jgi:hypothetical protein
MQFYTCYTGVVTLRHTGVMGFILWAVPAKHWNIMTAFENENRSAFNNKLKIEASSVLANIAFKRSPVLSKLLRYLVDETLKGNGGTLKSYSVAVDGLGKPETFDSVSDSSARVQMVRLRKALESHYAQHGPTEDLCLYLQPGSYKIRMGKLSQAYPQLYRPLSPIEHSVPKNPEHNNAPASGQSLSPTKATSRGLPILSGALAGVAIAILAWMGWQHLAQSRMQPFSPILELMPVEYADTATLNETAQKISSTFASDLPRFSAARVRILGNNERSPSTRSRDTVYRLTSRLEEDVEGNQKLYLRLTDTSSGTAFWSREVLFDANAGTASDALVSLTADISGPFGVIAAHGAALYRDRNAAGYACLLKYYSFVEKRAIELENQISACLQKPVEEQRLKATMLAAHALFTIERSSATTNFAAASDLALSLALKAVATNPNDAAANFALARMSYLTNDCVSARFYTRRAFDANANSPLILANLAALAPVCNHPAASAILDRAFLAQSPRYARGRLLLTLAALQQGRPDRLADIEPGDLPQSQFSRVNYYLTEALLSGAKGDREMTVQNWREFAAAQPSNSRDPEVLLRPIIALRPLRLKLVKLLADAGAFENLKN